MKDEIWKDIVDYENLYQISNYGNVKSLNYRRTEIYSNKISLSGFEKIWYSINWN